MSYAIALANPGSDIDKYLSQVYSIPVLTKEEELELTRKFEFLFSGENRY